MIKLNSVSKPKPETALESAVDVERLERVETNGSRGSANDEFSRAERDLTVVGKGDAIRPNVVRGALESVIDVDERIRILDTDLAPWRMICAMRMTGVSGGAAVGSGWLAGPRTIVTAGHCVHHQGFFGGWANKIEISAGRNGTEFPYGTLNATRFSSVDRWVNNADPDFDIGCIHLDESLGEEVGWFGFGALTPDELEEHMVNVSGYPGDRGNGTQQFFHANRILHVSDRRVFYDVDTAGGESGCPVFIRETQDSAPLVVGIHAYGTGGTPFDLGIKANSAPRIIPEVYEQIKAWVEADNASSA